MGPITLTATSPGGFRHSTHLIEEETKAQSELMQLVQDHTATGFEPRSICLQGRALAGEGYWRLKGTDR